MSKTTRDIIEFAGVVKEIAQEGASQTKHFVQSRASEAKEALQTGTAHVKDKMDDSQAWGPVKSTIEFTGEVAGTVGVVKGIALIAAGITTANPALAVGGLGLMTVGDVARRTSTLSEYRRLHNIDALRDIQKGIAQGDVILLHKVKDEVYASGKINESLRTVKIDTTLSTSADTESQQKATVALAA